MPALINIPIYRKDQYNRWHDLFPDFMFDTFEIWRDHHADAIRQIEIRGDAVRAIEVDIDEYLAWISTTRKNISHDTRMEFVSRKGFILDKSAAEN